MTEASRCVFGHWLQMILLWRRRESDEQNAAIGAKLRVRWHSTHVMGQDEVAGRDRQHCFRLLVDHVDVGGHLTDDTCRLNVRVVNWAIATVVQTGEDLHEGEIEDTD